MQRPLEGLRVADLSGGIAGQYCGKLFASFGAGVTLVEPPSGSPTRWLPPFKDGGPALERSFFFQHLNQGKQSVVIDLKTPTGRALLRKVSVDADVVIHDESNDPLDDLDERVITCGFREFPREGPYADWSGSEMIHHALGGNMFQTGRLEDPPLYGVGQRAYYAAGTTGYVAAMAAVLERESSGLGQDVGTTVFESTAAMANNLVTHYNYNGSFLTRGRYPGSVAVLECADGWAVIFALRNWRELCAAAGLPELAEDARFEGSAERLRNWEVAAALLQAGTITKSKHDFVAECQAGRVSAAVVVSLDELVGSAQWEARGMLRTVESADGERRERALGPVFRLSDAQTTSDGTSPTLGEQDGRVLRPAAGGRQGEEAIRGMKERR